MNRRNILTRVSPQMYDFIKSEANKERRTVSSYLRNILQDYFQNKKQK